MVTESEMIADLKNTLLSNGEYSGSLATNERVLARVTDGIYRQPGSAIRELIANAYDADATFVSVDTNAPKFDRIIVEDNGIGMSPEAVINLLNNIGGSAKRNSKGVDLGITSSQDESKSPGGRNLIGKLGIGMFSVSQLTRSFQIITKRKDDDFRTVVSVKLDQFSEADQQEETYQSGEYIAWLESTEEKESQGTTIILNSIRSQTKDSLSDKQFWESLASAETSPSEISDSLNIPDYYVGKLDDADFFLSFDRAKIDSQKIPWEAQTPPENRFREMVNKVWQNALRKTKVKLQFFFDAYYRMLWELSLSLPIEYVEGDLLDEPYVSDWAYTYQLSNDKQGSAKKIILEGDNTPRSFLGLQDSNDILPFEVFVDDIKLYRPIKYRKLPVSDNAIKKPMIFFGRYRQEFDGIDAAISCGPLDFYCYIFWNPKVVPTEHQGCLVRIHGSSGTLFDSSFFSYQVAELTRLRQVTCEIFVTEGLEAALNIDRESFNVAHPHTVMLTKWLHSALRQFATAQKRLAKELRDDIRKKQSEAKSNAIREIVIAENDYRTDGLASIPEIRFGEKGPNDAYGQAASSEGVSFSLNRATSSLLNTQARTQDDSTLKKLAAIMQLLAIYNALENLTDSEQDDLASAILEILRID